MPEELWTEVHNIVQEAVIITLLKKKKCKKVKWLSEEALQRAEKRREVKAKEKRKDIPIWMQSSKEEQAEIRKSNTGQKFTYSKSVWQYRKIAVPVNDSATNNDDDGHFKPWGYIMS